MSLPVTFTTEICLAVTRQIVTPLTALLIFMIYITTVLTCGRVATPFPLCKAPLVISCDSLGCHRSLTGGFSHGGVPMFHRYTPANCHIAMVAMENLQVLDHLVRKLWVFHINVHLLQWCITLLWIFLPIHNVGYVPTYPHLLLATWSWWVIIPWTNRYGRLISD